MVSLRSHVVKKVSVVIFFPIESAVIYLSGLPARTVSGNLPPRTVSGNVPPGIVSSNSPPIVLAISNLPPKAAVKYNSCLCQPSANSKFFKSNDRYLYSRLYIVVWPLSMNHDRLVIGGFEKIATPEISRPLGVRLFAYVYIFVDRSILEDEQAKTGSSRGDCHFRTGGSVVRK